MGFALRDLSVLAYAQGFTLWHYQTIDAERLGEPGYFNGAAEMIATGDMLLVSGPFGGRILAAFKEAGSVRTAPLG